MDKLEIASNISECPSSNFSSLSSLVQFDEEFCSFNSITSPDLSSIKGVKLSDVTTNLYNLKNQLELSNYEKVRKYNAELEMQLAHANNRISELVKNCADDKNFELYSEISELRGEIEGLELVSNNLKLDLEESKIDLDTKIKSVVGLKAKIVDLHIEMQVLTQSNIKLNNELCILRNDLMSSKKSELWYKDQLHECRKQKSHLIEEVSHLHTLLIGKERELSMRNIEFLHNNNFLQEIQMTYNREFVAKTAEVQSDPLIDIEAYESTIESLNIELMELKHMVDSQQESFVNINKQNSDLLTNNASLMKSICDKDVIISNLENDKKDLLINRDFLNTKLLNINHLMLELVNDKSQCEISLKESRREKAEIEDAVREIRDNFAKFTDRFRCMQSELSKSSRYIRELEESKRNLQHNNDKLGLDAQSHEDELASVKKVLEGEMEKSVLLNSELRVWSEYKIECERTQKILQYKNRKVKGMLHSELLNIKNRLIQTENRCIKLLNQAIADETDISALKTLIYDSKSNDEYIKNLKAFCKAKELEVKEKRSRYETNYRTLLKKVREYARARKMSEKQCNYLQDLHNHVMEELNTCKFHLQNLRSECDNIKNDNLKAKLDLSKSQQECSMLEKQIRKYQEQARQHSSLYNKQQINNNTLEGKIKNLVVKLNESTNELASVQCKLDNETKGKQELCEKWLQEQHQNVVVSSALEDTRVILQQVKAEKESLSDEVENLTMKITCNMNELTELREQKIFLDTKRKLEELIINNLKSDIQLLTNDLATVKSDKYFLQRLCNDLKFALTTVKNQMEILKKHTSVSQESLSIQEIPSPSKCDEQFINELLKRSITPKDEKSLYQLHNNLNLLKKEMITLRKQVVNHSP